VNLIMVSMSMTEQQEAALRRLVSSGELSDAQVDAIRREFAVAPPAARTGFLVEIAGYLGGGLILGAVALFLGTSWERLGRATQTGILAAMAAIFIAAALLVAGGPRALKTLTGARHRVVGVLFALAPIPAALAAGVAANTHESVWGFGVGFVVAAACYAALPNALSLVATAGMSVGAVGSIAGEMAHATSLGTGIAILGLGAAWAALSLLGWARPKTLGLVIGFGFAIIGAQIPLSDNDTEIWAYGLTLAVAAACLLIYRWERSLAVLAGGVVGVTLAVPEIISDATDGALGGAAILLIAGVVLVGASAIGMQLHRRRQSAG
jgi:hypothetical protein